MVEQVTFHALDRIRGVRIRVDATGMADREALWQELIRQGHSLRLQHEGRSIVVAVSIINATRSQSWLQAAELEDMLERLRRATDQRVTDQFLWWDSLQPELTPSGQPELPIEGAYGSALARTIEQVRKDPDRLVAAVRGPALQMEERLRTLGFEGGDPTVLVAQAEQLVAQLLSDERTEQ
jgi:hypothetical protein